MHSRTAVHWTQECDQEEGSDVNPCPYGHISNPCPVLKGQVLVLVGQVLVLVLVLVV